MNKIFVTSTDDISLEEIVAVLKILNLLNQEIVFVKNNLHNYS